eukprot:13246473-Alexandrium_andersonii.AAC.1
MLCSGIRLPRARAIKKEDATIRKSSRHKNAARTQGVQSASQDAARTQDARPEHRAQLRSLSAASKATVVPEPSTAHGEINILIP